jgi:hypothetical protein
MRHASRFLVTIACVGLASTPLAALDAKVAELRSISGFVRIVLELKSVFKSDSKQWVEPGGILYVRVQAELWEDRTAWDRLVAPAKLAVFRVRRDGPAKHISVGNPSGGSTPYADFPDALPLEVDVAPLDRISDDAHYYLHASTTVGTAAERESEDMGDVVFGRDKDASGLAAVGKLLFRTAQGINDYLQSTTADVTSRKVTGRQIRAGASGR